MIKQWMWIGLLASLVLLGGCKRISVEGVPEEQLVDVWATSNASTTQIAEGTVSTSTPAATPTSLSKWDDRSVYAQTLSASGRQYLDELPMA
ncbi:MAG: hypothetical protein GWN14_26290, partial [candidate division Zixibacteria bacterium]|nr:hypothetical protein [candidate division Zixibacteria bacterium]NIX59334.1 hypothetical protein [candidate division Zixibacteria bacterium]